MDALEELFRTISNLTGEPYEQVQRNMHDYEFAKMDRMPDASDWKFRPPLVLLRLWPYLSVDAHAAIYLWAQSSIATEPTKDVTP